MRRTSVLIGVAVVFSMASLAYSTNMTFTSSGTIEDADSYDNVYVENDFTVVDMFGGQVGNLQTGNVSTFNLHGGQIAKVVPVGPDSIIDIGSASTINILNGVVDIGVFVLFEDSYTRISGGSVTAKRLKAYGDCTVDVTGGLLQLSEFDMVGREQLPTINVYGYDFIYDPTGGAYEGILTGYLVDGNPFVIDNVNESEYLRFNLIPEPTTCLLLGLGGLFLRKRR